MSFLHNYFPFFFQAKDIFDIHRSVCPRAQETNEVQVSCDGVKESKSTSISMDIFSSKFTNCKCVYPHVIIRPLGKYKDIDQKKHLRIFVQDILDTGVNIAQFVGDNPKRSDAKEVLSHSSYFPCEYCFSRGISTCICNVPENVRVKQLSVQKQLINEKMQTELTEEEKKELENLEKTLDKDDKQQKKKKKSKITWPASTANGELRTKEKIIDIVENIEDLSSTERKGIVGKSIFLEIPNFDIVEDIPAEYMHSVCLGVIKKVVELTFAVGQPRVRETKRPLSKPSQFNLLMLCIKTPQEFSRRARELDFAVLKAAEFRNICIFYFPLVLECIEDQNEERELWVYMAYMVRVCVLPSSEFQLIDQNVFEACHMKFYVLYEKLFGEVNCTYNTHVVCSHLPRLRCNGPVTETSAFVFESFYGEMRNCFVPGTISPLKQIFSKVLLKRILGNHCCEIPISFADHETSLQNDTLIYVWEDNCHNMYLIKEVQDNQLICNTIEKEEIEFEEVPTTIKLNWKAVGVYKKIAVREEEEIIVDKKHVSGKVLQVKEFLLTCPNNVLREK